MRLEHGGIVIGWLLRVIVSIALFGVLVFEAGAVIVANVDADSAARNAALEAVHTYDDAKNYKAAKKDAEEVAKQEGAVVVAFDANTDGVGGQARVTVTVEKQAATLFIHKIGFLKRFRSARATSRAFGT